MSLDLAPIEEQLAALPLKRVTQLGETLPTMAWTPNPGRQTEAFNCEADELLYGGSAGSGKTDLGIGLAVTKHRSALILRRMKSEVESLVERAATVLGHRDGYNGQHHRWNTPDGHLIQFGGCQYSGDEESYKGERKSLIALDEASGFLESQVVFLSGWLGSPDPRQHCMLLLATNPPTSSEGEWIVRWFAPWLDPTHPLFPYPPGKLLWYFREGDNFVWFTEEPSPRLSGHGKPVKALTRTFIRAWLSDNPDYAESAYKDRLAGLPDELRRRYEMGDFTIGLKDDEWQVIPTTWITAAQERWQPFDPRGRHQDMVMSALAIDPAGGGSDREAIAYRYGAWCAPVLTHKGDDTADGSKTAARVFTARRNGCQVIVDVGGGYGGSVRLRLRDNNIEAKAFQGAASSARKTRDKQLGFVNKRAEAWWRFREELNPDQEGGSAILLPPDPELRADLTAPRWENKAGGIQIESKEHIRKRLGRSPDKGDAVVMCFMESTTPLTRLARADSEQGGPESRAHRTLQTMQNMGYSAARRMMGANRHG